jgi:hypothetical protein
VKVKLELSALLNGGRDNNKLVYQSPDAENWKN